MPKQAGPIKLKGTLNGVCYYQLNGQYVQRKANGPSKERIYNDPAFTAVKANLQEFGAASKLSKAICQGLQQNVATFKDSYMTSRLTGCCRSIIKKGSGLPGQRKANLLNEPVLLIGFQLNKAKVFNQMYTAKPVITSNTDRTNIIMSIPKSSKNNLKQAPKTTTHFRLTAALSTVSNYKWSENAQAYQPEHPKQNALGTTIQTVPLVCKIEHQKISLELQSPIHNNMHQNIAITVWLGIQFGNLVQNKFKPFKTAQAMACIAIL